jgi:hypothetical protein
LKYSLPSKNFALEVQFECFFARMAHENTRIEKKSLFSEFVPGGAEQVEIEGTEAAVHADLLHGIAADAGHGEDKAGFRIKDQEAKDIVDHTLVAIDQAAVKKL